MKNYLSQLLFQGELPSLPLPQLFETLELPSKGNIYEFHALAQKHFSSIYYQNSIMRNVLLEQGYLRDPTFFETVGSKINSNTSIGIYLDTLARCLYADLEFLEKHC